MKPESGNKPVMEKRVVERKPPPPDTKSADSIHLFPKSLTFGFHTAEDIRKISVVQISKKDSFNQLGHPINGGLYDPFMGPSRETDEKRNLQICSTCLETFNRCPGHYGHIELPLPVYHPLFVRNLIGIIKLTCPTCKRFFLLGMVS
jgi:DNA-directed RNA polymerase I subunit RPA1